MAENSHVRTITDANIATEVEQSQGLVMVDFWAAWCGPCRMIAPSVEQLATEYQGSVKVGKLDVDANPHTSARFNVRSIPSILFFKDGTLVDTLVGAMPKTVMEQRIKAHLPEPVAENV